MIDYLKTLIDTDAISQLWYPWAFAYLVLLGVVMFVGKAAYQLLSPFSVNEQLTEKDNRAVAVSMAGYLFGLGLILWGVMGHDMAPPAGETPEIGWVDYANDLGQTAIWGGIGIVLLLVARFINDKLLMPKFDLTKELVGDHNVGAGMVDAGALVGSSMIVKASLTGETAPWGEMIVGTLIFFVVGQLAFLVYSFLYQKVVRFNVHDELEKDNVAAGVSLGLNLVAVGVLISQFMLKSDSLPALGVWFLGGTVVMLVMRVMTDKVILPWSKLDKEIAADRNWGAAAVEGAVVIGTAYLVSSAF
ncbi:MAG: DUF350 domain-containing protein [Planctomycetes bacterium]|nr:DUF350 domain-containing protein [Planctomycetota bacterium]MCB9935104.1 DUF350 domain-containing protein [Planctomycetota bacterium]